MYSGAYIHCRLYVDGVRKHEQQARTTLAAVFELLMLSRPRSLPLPSLACIQRRTFTHTYVALCINLRRKHTTLYFCWGFQQTRVQTHTHTHTTGDQNKKKGREKEKKQRKYNVVGI